MNCANPCSSRPQPQMCSRSSAVRPVNWSRCLRPCLQTQRKSVGRNLAFCIDPKAICFAQFRYTERHPRLLNNAGSTRCSVPVPVRRSDGWQRPKRWFRSLTSKPSRPIKTIRYDARASSTSPALAPWSACRCSKIMRWSAQSLFTVSRCGRSPTSRSSW